MRGDAGALFDAGGLGAGIGCLPVFAGRDEDTAGAVWSGAAAIDDADRGTEGGDNVIPVFELRSMGIGRRPIRNSPNFGSPRRTNSWSRTEISIPFGKRTLKSPVRSR